MKALKFPLTICLAGITWLKLLAWKAGGKKTYCGLALSPYKIFA
jgi:hypothetical protein